jgi:ABC-type Fe3+-hydroxamate transport system substrate-binding protein
MKFVKGLIVALAVVGAQPAAARDITDSAGRTVAVPERVERVFAAGPPASALLCARRARPNGNSCAPRCMICPSAAASPGAAIRSVSSA